MKILWLGLFSFGLFTSSALAVDSTPLHFNAVLVTGAEKHFGLATDNGAHSGWVVLGQSFEGYTLKAYDEKTSVLTLEHEGATATLPLEKGTIATAASANGTPATLADASAVIDQMHFEVMIQKAVDQQKKSMAAMMKKMSALNGRPADPELEAQQAKMTDMLMAALDPQTLKTEMARIYSETFTKEELHAMGDFYSTPAGQSLINKQPEVQQKLNEVIMPRMMAIMPKIQQMAAEAAKQRAANAAATAPTPAPAPTAPPPASKTP